MNNRNSVNWSNPYEEGEGFWLKGNLHTHTSPANHCVKFLLPDDGYSCTRFTAYGKGSKMAWTQPFLI
ncbi:MAG: hypothetical protein ABIA63_13110 [bacterium]